LAAAAVVLTAWFGLIAGLPHTHSHLSHSLHEGDARATGISSTSGGAVTSPHDSGHPAQSACLACLVSGTTALSATRTIDLRPASAVGVVAVVDNVVRVRSLADLPDQRGPPAGA